MVFTQINGLRWVNDLMHSFRRWPIAGIIIQTTILYVESRAGIEFADQSLNCSQNSCDQTTNDVDSSSYSSTTLSPSETSLTVAESPASTDVPGRFAPTS